MEAFNNMYDRINSFNISVSTQPNSKIGSISLRALATSISTPLKYSMPSSIVIGSSSKQSFKHLIPERSVGNFFFNISDLSVIFSLSASLVSLYQATPAPRAHNPLSTANIGSLIKSSKSDNFFMQKGSLVQSGNMERLVLF